MWPLFKSQLALLKGSPPMPFLLCGFRASVCPRRQCNRRGNGTLSCSPPDTGNFSFFASIFMPWNVKMQWEHLVALQDKKVKVEGSCGGKKGKEKNCWSLEAQRSSDTSKRRSAPPGKDWSNSRVSNEITTVPDTRGIYSSAETASRTLQQHKQWRSAGSSLADKGKSFFSFAY